MRIIPPAVRGLIPLAPGLWNLFRGKPFLFSINVANMCPLNCDCYWRIGGEAAKGTEIQLTEVQMLEVWSKNGLADGAYTSAP